MKLRIWLVAGLLLGLVNVCGPAARLVSLRTESCITWLDSSDQDQIEVSEPRQVTSSQGWRPFPAFFEDDAFQATTLDRILFQRPPPPSLLRS